MESKVCTKCKIEKLLSEFHKHKIGKYGRKARCKECTKEENKAYHKKYYEENRDKVLLDQKRYREEHPEEVAKKKKEEYHRNKATYQKRRKIYHQNNREVELEKMRVYSQNNKDKTNSYLKHKRKTDVRYNLKISLRNRLTKALARVDTIKCETTMDLLGCTPYQFEQHLESQFTGGMDWSNHTQFGWHIDHIKPCTYFDLTDPEQQKECFHYTNLQPLWWYDNLEKSNKLDWKKEI